MQNKIINNLKIFSPCSSEELIDYAFKERKILIAINAEKILNSNDEFKNITNKNIGYPDGIGALWALKKKGVNSIKIAGCELWLDIITKKVNHKKFYLIGGKEEVIKNTVKKLKIEFPLIQIVNYRDGYINSEEEIINLENDIIDKKPDVIFVAMGSPKQELLMERLMKKYPAIYQGLGGSFDVYTGNVKRAPKWWINNNLEWAYRLLKQPSRIKRQIHLLKFVWNMIVYRY